MNDFRSVHLFSYSSQFSKNYDAHESSLIELLDWCKIVRCCLESGQIEEAKFFLAQAITEAEKPIKD